MFQRQHSSLNRPTFNVIHARLWISLFQYASAWCAPVLGFADG